MKKLILLASVIILAFTACSKLNNGPGPHRDRLTKLLLQDTLKLYVGETRNLPLTVTPSDYDLDSIKYKSSDTTVLTISEAGVLSAKKVGLSTVTISNLTGSISINSNVTVVPAPIDSLKLGLVGYYPFNNSVADSSGMGNNGTAYNLQSAADRFGNQNSAYHFDGQSSYIYIKDNLYMRLYATDFTESVWIKLDDYNPSYGSAILCKRIPGIADAGYTFSIGGYTSSVSSSSISTAGIAHFGPGGGSANNALSATAIPIGQWHLVTCVYSYTSKTIKFYIDGLLDSTTPNIASPNASVGAAVFIGRDDPSLEDNGYYIDGTLDDIRVYNRALSAEEIHKLYILPY